jgi:hypothetical protein
MEEEEAKLRSILIRTLHKVKDEDVVGVQRTRSCKMEIGA